MNIRAAFISVIIALPIINCHSALALTDREANDFGNNFIKAMQAGKSAYYIPQQFHLDAFLYQAFGQDYLNLTPDEKKQTKVSLINSLKILHSAPLLVDYYKQLEFLATNLEQVNNDYIYSFASRFPGDNPTKNSIYLKEINGKIWIVDINNGYWLTKYIADFYQKEFKGKMSIPEIMKMLENKNRQEFL